MVPNVRSDNKKSICFLVSLLQWNMAVQCGLRLLVKTTDFKMWIRPKARGNRSRVCNLQQGELFSSFNTISLNPTLQQTTSELWELSGGYERILSELYCAVLCTVIVQNHMHTHMSIQAQFKENLCRHVFPFPSLHIPVLASPLAPVMCQNWTSISTDSCFHLHNDNYYLKTSSVTDKLRSLQQTYQWGDRGG